MALISNDNGATHRFYNRAAWIFNSGDMALAGKLRVQGNHGGFTGIDNTGYLAVQGEKGQVERLTASSGPGTFGATQIINRDKGVIGGSGGLTYVNATEADKVNYLNFVNLGTISPGEGHERTSKSIGRLSFKNVKVCFGGDPAIGDELKFVNSTHGGTLLVDIGGLANAPDACDRVIVTGEKGGGSFELVKGTGNTLNIIRSSGFTPHGTYRIVTATKVTGIFDVLQLNGMTGQVPYKVNYSPNGIDVIFP